MAEPWAKIPISKYNELNKAAARVNGTPSGNGGSPGEDVAHYFICRPAKIIGCAKSTGYADAQFCSGDPGGTLTPDASLTFKVFIGKNPYYRKDDFVLIAQAAYPSLRWEAIAPITSFTLYKDPATDGSTLATTQDNPVADSYCTESITVP